MSCSVLIFFFFLFRPRIVSFFFFFNDTATTEIYTLSLHDALPISAGAVVSLVRCSAAFACSTSTAAEQRRSEEHTSELQSLAYLVCRLLLEKKKKKKISYIVDYDNDIQRVSRYT